MKRNKAYLVGIKGVAMTALAVYLKEKGFVVTGSDVEDQFFTDQVLKKYHIKIKKGFSGENIDKKYDVVVVTGAHGGMTNPEARRARQLGLPVFMHGQFLGQLMSSKEGISVAGCHGKTTTSALVASLLTHAGLDPSYAIGAPYINDLGPAGHFGRGKYFVAEADEYMTCPLTCSLPRFLWQAPKILVFTNIDYDHPDAFANIEETKKAFLDFASKLSDDGVLIACTDDDNVRGLLPLIRRQIVTYGFSPQADYRLENCYFGEGISFMRVSHRGVRLGEFMLKISGKHNLLNALAASIVANLVGIGWDKIKDNLKLFTGSKRRFEKVAQVGGKLLYDDYAHHPSEIVATIIAAKEWFPQKRLVVIFQPHTFSRTKVLLSDFAKAFKAADVVIFTDIYPSFRERFDPTVSSQLLAVEANKYKKNTFYFPNKKKTLFFLGENLSSNDLVLTLGAGDIFLWHEEIIKLLKSHE